MHGQLAVLHNKEPEVTIMSALQGSRLLAMMNPVSGGFVRANPCEQVGYWQRRQPGRR